MPLRKYILANNEIYHVYNRSVGDEEILTGVKNISFALELINYYRFLQSLRFSKFKLLNNEARKFYNDAYLNKKPLVEILAFSLMPNHYHFLLKQNVEDGIKTFISNFQNSFARHFNLKNKRNGSLFLNPFKAKRIENDNIFKHVSRYIHLNPVTSYLIKPDNLQYCSWNSFGVYTDNITDSFVTKDVLLKMFGSAEKYSKFVLNQVDYQRRLRDIKSQMFD